MRLWALALMVICSLLPARGDTIYAATVTGDILALDPIQLTPSVLVHTGICWYDIALSREGVLYGSDGSNLFRIDQVSGVSRLVGSFGRFVNAMTFVGETLYASGGSGLYKVDLASGHAGLVGSTGYNSAGDLQWFGEVLYLTVTGAPGDKLVTVDPASGMAALVGDIGFPQVYGLAVSDGQLYGVTAAGDLLEINASTGVGTRVGAAGGRVYGATGPVSEVPEPGALLLLGSGLTLLGARRRRS